MDDQEAIEKLLVALRHPIRRRVLLETRGGEEPMSPKGMAAQLRMPVSNVSYHVRVLAECGALRLVGTQPKRGSMQHFYEVSELLGHPLAKAALGLEDGAGA
jgi:DNA-binding transcriptional ArsR family regulator